MIFYYFIIVSQGLSCIEKEYQNIHLYPTIGEYMEYPMSNLFEGENLLYHYNPIIPNVSIANAFTEITQIEGCEFISISSNLTHFAAITNLNQLILYEWQNLNIQQYGQIVNVEKKYQCYNVILLADIDILLDCYTEDNFYLLKLKNISFDIVYSFKAKKPNSSEIKGIFNEPNAFLIYAQYYKDFSILTLFSSQFNNLTSYQNQFIQFGIPQRTNPYIYLLFREFISQFIITQNQTFEETLHYAIGDLADTFYVYYNYQTFSQCDQLWIQSQGRYQQFIEGCQNQLVQYDYGYIYPQQQVIQQFFNNEFLLIQQQNSLTLYQTGDFDESIGFTEINSNSQIFFNPYDCYLFIFNKQITVYQLAIPNLSINLTEQQASENNYNITIYSQPQNLTFKGYCRIFMSITILNQNDTSVYVIYKQSFSQYKIITNEFSYQQGFTAYSGKLLQYVPILNNQQFGSFIESTFKEYFKLEEQYYLAQFLKLANYTVYQSSNKISYFIGVTNKSIQIFKLLDQKEFNYLMHFINISIQAQSLQVAYDIYGTLIIGLSNSDKIYLYQIPVSFNGSNFTSHYKFKQEFSEFLVTYNNLITLFKNGEIQIMTLNFTNLVIVNQNLIQQLFKLNDLHFNPIQIAVNVQSLSSCLFINNINNVIIILIGQNNQPAPISIINVQFKIQSINIVNQQLVLSYYCNKGSYLCFQVWSIQNFKQPFFIRNMASLHNNNQMQMQSDSLFFYVQFSNYTVFVYNPQQPEHMNLYQQLNLSSKLICTLEIEYSNQIGVSMFYENKFNILSATVFFQFSVNQSLNFERTYPSIIYNYSVTSLLNLSAIQYTPNQSLTYFSNFTYFQPYASKNINLSLDDLNLVDRTFTIPMSIIIDRQVSICDFPNSSNKSSSDQYFSNQICSLTNFGYYNILVNKNFSLVTAINNKFFVLQDYKQIQTINSKNEQLSYYDYSYLNFTGCLKSTSFNLTLSSICQNETAQYWLSISFDYVGNVVTQNISLISMRFTKIIKISNIGNLNFILGSSNNFYSYVYLFTSQNGSMNKMSKVCQDFSVALYNSNLDRYYLCLIETIVASCQQFSLVNNSIKIFKFDYLQVQSFCIQILILQIIDDQILLFLTGREGIGQFNLVNGNNNNFALEIGIFIPNYGDLLPIPTALFSNGFLLQQFQYEDTYIIGVYQIKKFIYDSLNEPILMLGSLNSTSLEYALITNEEDNNATCVTFNNGQVISYPINTKTLKCHFKKHSNTVQINTQCTNAFSNGIYELTFYLPDLNIHKSAWIYTLIAIITVQLIGFYILVKYRMKNLGYINTEIEI
ncbi:unnamed protein product [Paramecium octaurelia]|uniref:Transmembrane protein n=1 Tax=Paramecium octaurelia TaxID=43137 RepID=A0A8S1YJ46_PAROT|nr:unnamed protein product [Paramecium octaurelia]